MKKEPSEMLKALCNLSLLFGAIMFFPITIMVWMGSGSVTNPSEKITEKQKAELAENLRIARAERKAAGFSI